MCIRDSNKGNAPLIGVKALTNSFDKVISSTAAQKYRDARGVSGLLETMLAQSATAAMPTKISFSPNIKVQNSQLYDILFAVDGINGKYNLGSMVPRDGVAAATANFLLAFIKDAQHLHPNIINWINDVAGQRPKKVNTFGVEDLLFEHKDVLQTMALMVSRDFYRTIVSPTEEGRGDGLRITDEILNEFPFLQFATSLAKGSPIPVRPPKPNEPKWRREYASLWHNFHLKKQTRTFPRSPGAEVLELRQEIKVRGLFNRVSNEEVIINCERRTAEYLGQSFDNKPSTVHGWTAERIAAILDNFTNYLIVRIEDLFYDPKTKKPITLNERPDSLIILCDMLKSLKEHLTSLQEKIKTEHEFYVENDGVIVRQRERVEQEKQRLRSNPDSKELQEQYIQQHQHLLELQVWDTLMVNAERTATELETVVNKLWHMVGYDAEGWASYLENSCLKKVEDKLASHQTACQEIANAACREFVPSPGSPGEDKIYNDLVLREDLLASLLKDVSWDFYSEKVDMTGFSPREKVGHYVLRMNFPNIQGFDKKTFVENLTHVQTGRLRRFQTSCHVPEETTYWATVSLKPRIFDISIWRALAIDFETNWLPNRRERGMGESIDDYVQERIDLLMAGSEPLLSETAAEVQPASTKVFCFGDFRNVAKPQSLEDKIATTFHNQLSQQTTMHTTPTYSRHLSVVKLRFHIPYTHWGYWNTAMNNYLAYTSSLDSQQVHVMPHLRNANRLSRWLKAQGYFAKEQKFLDLSVVNLLADSNGSLDTFTHVSLAYLLGLFDHQQGDSHTDQPKLALRLNDAYGQQLSLIHISEPTRPY
jgi:hypothetical protein